MATVTQTIDNYYAGISNQPDMKKFPGQVKDIINAVPDPIEGLYKRPGSERIGTTPLTNVQTNGSWFHYYRDETEGTYIGQVASDGKIRMWCTKDLYNASGTKVNDAGDEIFVHYNTVSGAYNQSNYNGSDSNHTSITNYLTPSSATSTEDIQALTINDTTFLNNRTKPVLTEGTTTGRPDANFAFIDLLRTENGRQYNLNIYSDETPGSLKVATRIKLESDTVHTANTHGKGNCPAIGTEVYSVSGSDYTITNAVSATFATVDDSGSSNNRVNVTKTNHGFKTGDQVTVTSSASGFTNQTKAVITKTDADNFYYISDSDQGDHAAGTACTIASPHINKTNLIFRLTVRGSQSLHVSGDGGGDDSNDYSCVYQKDVVLLHGGEGWETGDQIAVTLEGEESYDYAIKITDSESISVKGTIGGGFNGALRPTPTPFDADTAVSPDMILGGITTEIANMSGSVTVSTKVIGNGIYLYSTGDFNVEVLDRDLMRVMQSEVNDIADLPLQCKHGYIVKVSNARESEGDDYYVKFAGEGGLDGPGAWIECPKPGIVKGLDATSMPHVLQRQAISGSNPVIFLAKKYTWEDRVIGDDTTNPLPTFVSIRSTHPDYDSNVGNIDKYINRVLFFRNRLALISGENVILSRPGELGTPSFFAKTALAVSAVDPIDISCSSTFPSDLYDGMEVAAGLAVFSTNQQFLLSSDAEVLNPDTAKLRSIATYNYNKDISPISLGTTVGYVDNSGKYSRFNEMANIQREQEPTVVETSKIVPTLLPKNIDLITNSRENQLVLFAKTNDDTCFVYGYKYMISGEERLQTAWFKWKLNNPIKYHFIVDDEYYFLDTDNFLQRISIMQQDADPSIDENNVNYLIHLDNWTTVGNGSYNATTKVTTFANQSDWIDQVTSPNGDLVLVDLDTSATRVGRYAQCTVTNTDDFTVPGDWSTGTFYIGYLYEYSVAFPTLYMTKTEGQQSKSDVNSSLVIHRIKLNFGKSGLYTTTLQRTGKDDYSETYESANLDEYLVSDAPYLPEHVQTIPVYESNKNVNILLKSSHPAPATLHAMSWEGDYSPRNYRRV